MRPCTGGAPCCADANDPAGDVPASERRLNRGVCAHGPEAMRPRRPCAVFTPAAAPSCWQHPHPHPDPTALIIVSRRKRDLGDTPDATSAGNSRAAVESSAIRSRECARAARSLGVRC
jgi:hypothetical protein